MPASVGKRGGRRPWLILVGSRHIQAVEDPRVALNVLDADSRTDHGLALEIQQSAFEDLVGRHRNFDLLTVPVSAEPPPCQAVAGATGNDVDFLVPVQRLVRQIEMEGTIIVCFCVAQHTDLLHRTCTTSRYETATRPDLSYQCNCGTSHWLTVGIANLADNRHFPIIRWLQRLLRGF